MLIWMETILLETLQSVWKHLSMVMIFTMNACHIMTLWMTPLLTLLVRTIIRTSLTVHISSCRVNYYLLVKSLTGQMTTPVQFVSEWENLQKDKPLKTSPHTMNLQQSVLWRFITKIILRRTGGIQYEMCLQPTVSCPMTWQVTNSQPDVFAKFGKTGVVRKPQSRFMSLKTALQNGLDVNSTFRAMPV